MIMVRPVDGITVYEGHTIVVIDLASDPTRIVELTPHEAIELGQALTVAGVSTRGRERVEEAGRSNGQSLHFELTPMDELP